jgi:hypothetical protein
MDISGSIDSPFRHSRSVLSGNPEGFETTGCPTTNLGHDSNKKLCLYYFKLSVSIIDALRFDIKNNFVIDFEQFKNENK